MTGSQIIVLAMPVFLLLMALEFAVGRARGRNTYRLNDPLASVGLGVMSQVTGVFGKLLRLGIYVLAFDHLARWRLPACLPIWLRSPAGRSSIAGRPCWARCAFSKLA